MDFKFYGTNMEIINYCTLALALILTILSFLLVLKKNYERKSLPPKPGLALPILGHLHHFFGKSSNLDHISVSYISRYCGPITYFIFGSHPMVVVSSASVAEECLSNNNNDIVLANRPLYGAAKLLSYDYTTLPFAPYGEHWRNLRRVAAIHIFSSLSIKNYADIWTEEIHFKIRDLFNTKGKNHLIKFKGKEIGGVVELLSFLKDLVQNVIMKMVCGQRWSTKADDVFGDLYLCTLSDFFPIIGWLGLDKEKKEMEKLSEEMDKFLQDLIDEARTNRNRNRDDDDDDDQHSSSRKKKKKATNILEACLSLQEAEPDYYTDNLIKTIINMMFIAGKPTLRLALTSAMVFLLYNPEVIKKARKEMEREIKPYRALEDDDIPKLKYLNCIIKETLRLCPPVPLALHSSSEDCTISGYRIPKGTTFGFNIWWIHKDPSIWEEGDKFKPERFEGRESNGGYMPFGKGRRSCPGSNLAMRFMGLTLGILIQSFDWFTFQPQPQVQTPIQLMQLSYLIACFRCRNID